MARSLGDQAVKPIGVIANPEVVERDIDLKKDRFVIMASDGVWEFLSSEEVVRVIEEALAAGGHEPAFAACERVVSKAAELWHQMEGTYRDDITVIILRLPCLYGKCICSPNTTKVTKTIKIETHLQPTSTQ
eukprot:231762_1